MNDFGIKIIKNLPAIFIIIFIPCYLPAQSFFSMRGLGEEIINTDAVMTSLGSVITLSYQNPSYPVIKENMIFEAGIIGSGVLGKESNYQRFLADARPNYLKTIFALPLDFSFGLGLSERFNQNFDIYSDTIANPGYRRHIVGYGGIYNFGFSVSRSFFQHVALGFEYNRNFGSSQESWFFEELPASNTTTDTVTTNYRGDLLKFGLGVSFWHFTLGGLYEKDLPVYIDSKVLSHGVVSDSISGLKFELPPRIGFGLSFNPVSQLAVYLDYFHRNSQDIKIGYSTGAIYRNSSKYSLGFAYRLDETHILRVGYRYYNWYFAATESVYDAGFYLPPGPIKEQAITLGSGLPIPKFGSLDFALELINRKGGPITENIFRLNLTLHYEEAWEKRKRHWGY
jgi:hypothetical protein